MQKLGASTAGLLVDKVNVVNFVLLARIFKCLYCSTICCYKLGFGSFSVLAGIHALDWLVKRPKWASFSLR